MANKYFIWKDAECKGVNPVWVELSGADFYKFINNPQNSKRRFVKEYFEDDKNSGYCKFEVTEERFREWRTMQKRKERNEDMLMANIKKHRLLDKDEVDENAVKAIPSVLSFDAPLSDDEEETTYHDIVPDMECGYENVEHQMLVNKLYQILECLSDEEREVLNHIYFNNSENKSENEIAKEMNISHQLLGYRKKKILKKLKIFFAET